MNNKKNITNKSNLRIASDTRSSTSSLMNNNTNNNHNNIDSSRNLTSSPGIPLSSPMITQTSHTRTKFTTSQSFPSLDDTSHTISMVSLNVKGLASSVSKFDAIIDDLFNKDISIIGLQETHITDQSANILFKNR